jgi:hypothetical protein
MKNSDGAYIQAYNAGRFPTPVGLETPGTRTRRWESSEAVRGHPGDRDRPCPVHAQFPQRLQLVGVELVAPGLGVRVRSLGFGTVGE